MAIFLGRDFNLVDYVPEWDEMSDDMMRLYRNQRTKAQMIQDMQDSGCVLPEKPGNAEDVARLYTIYRDIDDIQNHNIIRGQAQQAGKERST